MVVVVDDNTDTVSLIGLSWNELFLIDHVLIKTIYETRNKDVRKAAEKILGYCEAACNSVFETE